MITQKIKQWLSRMFAWWPWKRSAQIDVPHVVSNVNTGMTQEQSWRALPDGPMPQPGSMSVAVEQGKDEPIPDTTRFNSGEQIERAAQTQAPGAEEHAPPTRNADAMLAKRDIPAPTQEQQLAFLRYLVKRGIVNEGFPEGHEPDQYQNR